MIDLTEAPPPSAAWARLKRLVAAALALTLLFNASALSAAAGDAAKIEAGLTLALKICAKCHVVADGQPAPVLRPPAPSFSDIAARPHTTEAQLRAFLSHPHGGERRASGMAPFALTASQTDAAVAYLMSLRRQEQSLYLCYIQ